MVQAQSSVDRLQDVDAPAVDNDWVGVVVASDPPAEQSADRRVDERHRHRLDPLEVQEHRLIVDQLLDRALYLSARPSPGVGANQYRVLAEPIHLDLHSINSMT